MFLALGVALGEDRVGLAFDDDQLAQNLGIAALGVILVEGALTTRWADVRPVLAPATALAVLGVGASVGRDRGRSAQRQEATCERSHRPEGPQRQPRR
jgi:cell volume regulation protein A